MSNLSIASFELSHGRFAVEIRHEHLSPGRDVQYGCLEEIKTLNYLNLKESGCLRLGLSF